VLAMPEIDISSSEIRERVRRGVEVHGLVPAPVARYIELHHLYKGTTVA